MPLMDLLFLFAPPLAAALLCLIWRAQRLLAPYRERMMRRRIAQLLWAVATHGPPRRR